MIQGIKDLSTLEPCQEKIFPKFVQCINCLTYRVKNMMQAFKNQLHHNLVRIVSTLHKNCLSSKLGTKYFQKQQ